MSFIQCSDLGMSFEGGPEVFSNVTTGFERGSLTYLTGVSGAGKTTFINLLLALVAPSQGSIEVDSLLLSSLSRSQKRRYRRNIGCVFQDHYLLPNQTLFQNVALPLWLRGVGKKEVDEAVSASLARVGLENCASITSSSLSMGERQRGAIARAIVANPEILIADEPTGNLDPTSAHVIMTIFRELVQKSTAVIVATHDRTLFVPGDRVLAIENGLFVEHTQLE